MVLDVIELNKLSHLITQQVEQVTCLECCKTYIAPETALCGHTLCHVCWKKRRTCPICSCPVNRKTSKLNLPLQNLTEHINTLGELFEKAFNVKLDEFTLDTPGEFTSEDDPAKNVKEWLASSQNQFSAATVTSGLTSQDKQLVVEVPVVSKALVHTRTKTQSKPTKVICAAIPQDDWDKIETLPDTEDKNKENVVGPMDIEPFSAEDDFYTMQNPRRSSRNRDGKILDYISKKPLSSPEKQISKEVGSESDKKSSNTKQNWNNVKRMRKEFSKLNKKNRNKLNVSIEMYKKTQHSGNKSNIDVPPSVAEQIYDIDDNTPNNDNDDKNTRTQGTDDRQCRDSSNMEKPINTVNDKDGTELDNNSGKVLDKTTSEIHPSKTNTKSIPERSNHVNFYHSNYLPNKQQQSNENNFDDANSSKIKFLKMGVLCPKTPTHTHNIETINHYMHNNSENSNTTNNITISIKVGNSVTNVIIKNDNNDGLLKACADREIQVSLGPHNISQRDNIIFEIGEQSKPTTTHNDESVQPVDTSIKSKLSMAPTGKSASTKKNTASAETVTAQFEITASVEKELSKIMVCDTINNKPTQCYGNNKHQVSQAILTQSVSKKNLNNTSKDVEIIDDLQIFDSFSSNDNNVQLLKNTKPVPSEILLPSTHSKKYKSADKRSRETNIDYDLPKSKKMKTTLEKIVEVQSKPKSHSNISENNKNDSELINYESVMDQVFANIDMDIENRDRNTQQTQVKKGIDKDKETISQTQRSKIVSVPSTIHTEPSANLKEYYNQKDSENMFSIIEKENENCEITIKENIPGLTQQHIQDFLTPVACQNLETGTPQVIDKDDDSDKSIVEDTPQKNMSYSKLRQKNSSSVRELEQSQQFNKPEITEKISVAGVKTQSIINLSESVEFNKTNKDKTIIECVAQNQALETPLNINKFVDQIKHKSTPVARKSLNFENENNTDDPEITLCPTAEVAKNTQEKEFMSKAFESTPETPKVRTLALKNLNISENKSLYIAGSCLASGEITKLKNLCSMRKWVYVDKYTKNVTHLVVGVDEENKSQRSVKYMSALAAGKWIVSFEWVEKCLKAKRWVDEVNYEVLDSTGEPGPKRSRVAKRKLFQGITFYCMPPFSVLDVNTLKTMLEDAGGRVVNEAKQIRVTADTPGPALLLAEPENTQEDRFIYLTMELSIVPVNYEWVLNCLGNYTLGSLQDLLLCPTSLLPPITSQWPPCLLARDYDD